jgi:hypothetical protein
LCHDDVIKWGKNPTSEGFFRILFEMFVLNSIYCTGNIDLASQNRHLDGKLLFKRSYFSTAVYICLSMWNYEEDK